jgi:hypothetical protein
MTASILSGLSERDIILHPFPHIHKVGALDSALYDELAASFPSLEQISAGKPITNNKLYNLGAPQVVADKTMPDVWRNFFEYHCSKDFFRAFLKLWRPAIEQEYPDLTSRFGKSLDDLASGMRSSGKDKATSSSAADITLDCLFGINSPVTEVSTVRVPHIDNPHKLFSALLYFRDPEDDSSGGDLLLYRLKTPSYRHNAKLDVPEKVITEDRTISYRPNSLIMWLNTPRSIHGVTPRSKTNFPRRYINFIGESYNLPGGSGFFEERLSLASRIGSSLKRLRRAPKFLKRRK